MRGWIGTVGTAAAGGAVTTALLLATGALSPRDGGAIGADPPLGARSQLVARAAGAQGLSAGEIYRRAAPAVVAVRARAAREEPSPFAVGGGSAGSGFVIDGDEGLVVCSAHAIAAATEIVVTLTDGTALPGRTLGRDDATDLALLAVEADGRELPALDPAAGPPVRVGDPTLALGGVAGGAPTLTTGVVSSPGRRLTADGGLVLDGVLQTDAPLAPADAGGPLLDATGRLVGVTGLVRVDGAAVGYALPATTLTALLPELERAGRVRRGFLGILPGADGDGQGVRVGAVRERSPAARAGLRPGDAVVGLAGEEVESVEELARMLAAREPGDTVEVDLGRGTAHVRLAESPAEGAER